MLKTNKVKWAIVRIGLVTFACFSLSFSLETEDLLSNAGFDLQDGLGLPVDWNVGKNYGETGFTVAIDKEDKKVGEGALELAITDEITEKDISPSQSLQTFPFGEERLYFRAWVKYKNVNGQFQILVHQARKNPGPPWWEEIGGWKRFWHGGGTQNEWKQVEGDIPILDDANVGIFKIYLTKNQMAGCTVWVDNIEISTTPLDEVPIINKPSAKEGSSNFSILGNRVQFNRPTNYRLNVFTANGKRSLHLSGYGKLVDLSDAQLPGGYYILKMHSDIGNMAQPIILSE